MTIQEQIEVMQAYADSGEVVSEFKVGDWVRHRCSNNIYKVNGFSTHGQTKGWLQVPDEYSLIPSTECELWKPEGAELEVPND